MMKKLDKGQTAVIDLIHQNKDFLKTVEEGKGVLIHFGEGLYGPNIIERIHFEGKDIIFRSCPELKEKAMIVSVPDYLFEDTDKTFEVANLKGTATYGIRRPEGNVDYLISPN